MTRSLRPRFAWQTLFGSAASALLFSAFALVTPANAAMVTLCPNQATVGGFGETAVDVAGPLDATCGANSAVQITIQHTTDYGKLMFNAGMSRYPSDLTLGGLQGISANVSYTSNAPDQPYFLLDFTDNTKGLGQAAATDQILFIEFQPTTLSGNTLAVDPATTLFNMYDNTTGQYLQGGQQDKKTLNQWLAAFSFLNGEALQGIWIGEGLGANDQGGATLTINSLDVQFVPEPSSIALLGAGLVFLGFAGFGFRRGASRA